MNIVIPSAGLGSRFSSKGYTVPKPFIPVKGIPMIEHIVSNISTSEDKIFIILRAEHLDFWSSTNLLNRRNISLVPQSGRLDGAVQSVLLTQRFIDNDEPLMIANSDQWIPLSASTWRKAFSQSSHDAQILTFPSPDGNPKWSYADVRDNNLITRVAEKVAISDYATVGVYTFARGSDFVRGAWDMMSKDIRVNGEFYVCPVFNQLIGDSFKVQNFTVPMFGMGTPEDLEQNYSKIGVY